MGGGILLLAKPVVISAVQAGKAEERPLTPDVRESAGSEGKQGAERHRVACDGVRREDERAAAHRLRAPRGVWVGAHCERSSDQNLDSPTGASRGWRHAARVRKNRTACSSAHFTRIRAPQPTRSGARATFVHGHVGQSAFHPAATLRVDWRAKAVPVSEGDPSVRQIRRSRASSGARRLGHGSDRSAAWTDPTSVCRWACSGTAARSRTRPSRETRFRPAAQREGGLARSW